MADTAQHLTAILDYDRRGVALERETEGVCWPSTHIGIAFFSGIAFVCTCLVAFVCLCTCLICFAFENPTDRAIQAALRENPQHGFKTFPHWFCASAP
jgi:hypothetical protein